MFGRVSSYHGDNPPCIDLGLIYYLIPTQGFHHVSRGQCVTPGALSGLVTTISPGNKLSTEKVSFLVGRNPVLLRCE